MEDIKRAKLRLWLLIPLLFLISGCSEPRIDASTEERMKASSQKVRDSLSLEERLEYDEALKFLVFSKLNMKDLFAHSLAGADNTEAIGSRMRLALDGKTANEIIAEASQIKSEREFDKQKQEEVGAKLLDCLKTKVTLSNPRFKGSDGDWFELDITNNLSWAIGGYHIGYVIRGDGRSVPIMKEDKTGSISGGIEPGETKTVQISAYANVSSYKTTDIEVSLINIFDEEERKLIDNNITYIGMSSDSSPRKCDA